MSVDPIFWLLAAIGFVVLEAMTLNLVSIWFAVGSAAALLSCLVTGSFRVQAVVFVAVSTLCLLALKPLCALLQTQTVTRLSLANADTVLPLLLVWKKFRLSYPNFRTKKHRKWRSQRTCSVKTLLLRKKPMLISNSLIVGGIR